MKNKMGKFSRKNGQFFFLLLFLCLAAALPAGGGKEKGSVVRVTGRVRLVGSSPVYEIVITGQEGQWYIAREESHKLMDYQHQTLTVEGAEEIEQLTLANGLPAGERRTLSNIKIISVQ